MTVTLTYDATIARVHIDATNVLGITGPWPATVQRSLDNATWTTVRGAASLQAPGNALAADDYEFAPNVVNYYRAASNVAIDSYTRTVAAGSWGTIDTGQAWQGASPTWSTTGTAGRSTHAAAGGDINTLSGTAAVSDWTAQATIIIGQKLTGSGASQAMFPSFVLRYVDANNFYRLGLYYQPSATASANVGIVIRKIVAGVTTVLYSNLTWDVYDGSEFYALKVECIGTTIRIKAWRTTIAEPAPWTASVTDATFTAGSVGVASDRDGGITNVNPFITWDDVTAWAWGVNNRITVQSANINPALTALWLKSPIAPALNQIVSLGGSDFQADRPVRGGTFDVVGRSLPVAVTDVRGSRRYTLTIRTLTAAAAQAVESLLAGGNVLFLQAPTGKVVPSGGVYLRVADVKEHRLSVGNEHRLWTLPVVEVSAPGPDVVGP